MKSLSQLIEPGQQLTVRRHKSTMFGFSCAVRPIPEHEYGTILWEDSGHGVTVEASLDSFEMVANGTPHPRTSDAYLKVRKVTVDGKQTAALRELIAYAERNFIMTEEAEILEGLLNEMQ